MAGYPLGLRNNNPGNIRAFDTWQGQIGTNQGFVVFQDIPFGIRALAIVLVNKIDNGLDTIESIIYSYAPPSENNTEAYISQVVSTTGISRTAILNDDSSTIKKLMKGIIRVEVGPTYAAKIDDNDYNDAFSLLNWEITPVSAGIGAGMAIVLLSLGLYLVATMPKPKRAVY